jgi:CheY-like chemotaxis protein
MHSTYMPIVMVADYSEDTREVLKYWLEMRGCRVVEAINGRQAVELTLRDSPDLLLMAMRMPLLGGLDAARRIRESRNEIVFPIVAMSTYPTNESKTDALAAGCASFIAQPIDFDILTSVLGSLLPESRCKQSREPGRDSISGVFSLARAQRANA